MAAIGSDQEQRPGQQELEGQTKTKILRAAARLFMEGAARDRLVAVRRCGGTPMRQMRRPEGPSLASWAGSAVLGFLVSYTTLAGCGSRKFLRVSAPMQV